MKSELSYFEGYKSCGADEWVVSCFLLLTCHLSISTQYVGQCLLSSGFLFVCLFCLFVFVQSGREGRSTVDHPRFQWNLKRIVKMCAQICDKHVMSWKYQQYKGK